jgi:hypothetical protein
VSAASYPKARQDHPRKVLPLLQERETEGEVAGHGCSDKQAIQLAFVAANCSSSVDPARAAVEAAPLVIACATWSK